MASSVSRSGSDENYKVKCAYGEKGENNVREFHSNDERVVSAELFEGQARRICTQKGVNANYSHGNGNNAKRMNETALQRCQMLNSEYMSTSFSDLEKRCVNMYLHTTRSCDTSGKQNLRQRINNNLKRKFSSPDESLFQKNISLSLIVGKGKSKTSIHGNENRHGKVIDEKKRTCSNGQAQSWEEELFDHSDLEEQPRPKLLPYFGRLAPMPPMDPYARPETPSMKKYRQYADAFRGFLRRIQNLTRCCSA